MGFWDWLQRFNETEVLRITVVKKGGESSKQVKIGRLARDEKKLIDVDYNKR